MKLDAKSAISRAVAFAAFSACRPLSGSGGGQCSGARHRREFEGSTLTVKTREGPTSALALKPGWKVTGVTAASLGDIKPGDFVGIASLPTASGRRGD